MVTFSRLTCIIMTEPSDCRCPLVMGKASLRFNPCHCPPLVKKFWTVDLLYPDEEPFARCAVFCKEGYYDVKKLIRNVWVPSSKEAQDAGQHRHLCKRFFWCYLGLGGLRNRSIPVWFMWPTFPGWIIKTPRPPTPIACKPELVARDTGLEWDSYKPKRFKPESG